jgi:hypothetical protein
MTLAPGSRLEGRFYGDRRAVLTRRGGNATALLAAFEV